MVYTATGWIFVGLKISSSGDIAGGLRFTLAYLGIGVEALRQGGSVCIVDGAEPVL